MKLRTYCFACKKYTNNIASRKVTMTNKAVRDKSKHRQCFSDISRFLKQKPNKKVVYKFYKTNMLTYCLKCTRNTKNIDEKMIKTKNSRLALSSKCVVCGSKNQDL